MSHQFGAVLLASVHHCCAVFYPGHELVVEASDAVVGHVQQGEVQHLRHRLHRQRDEVVVAQLQPQQLRLQLHWWRVK